MATDVPRAFSFTPIESTPYDPERALNFRYRPFTIDNKALAQWKRPTPSALRWQREVERFEEIRAILFHDLQTKEYRRQLYALIYKTLETRDRIKRSSPTDVSMHLNRVRWMMLEEEGELDNGACQLIEDLVYSIWPNPEWNYQTMSSLASFRKCPFVFLEVHAHQCVSSLRDPPSIPFCFDSLSWTDFSNMRPHLRQESLRVSISGQSPVTTQCFTAAPFLETRSFELLEGQARVNLETEHRDLISQLFSAAQLHLLEARSDAAYRDLCSKESAAAQSLSEQFFPTSKFDRSLLNELASGDHVRVQWSQPGCARHIWKGVVTRRTGTERRPFVEVDWTGQGSQTTIPDPEYDVFKIEKLHSFGRVWHHTEVRDFMKEVPDGALLHLHFHDGTEEEMLVNSSTRGAKATWTLASESQRALVIPSPGVIITEMQVVTYRARVDLDFTQLRKLSDKQVASRVERATVGSEVQLIYSDNRKEDKNRTAVCGTVLSVTGTGAQRATKVKWTKRKGPKDVVWHSIDEPQISKVESMNRVFDVVIIKPDDNMQAHTGDVARLARDLEAEQDFLLGQVVTDLALLKGRHLLALKLKEDKDLHKPLKSALTRQTRSEHREIIRICTNIHEDLYDLPFVTAILEQLAAARTKAQWKPSTWQRKLGSAIGAFERLDLYTQVPVQLNLQRSAVWRDALRQAKQDANRQVVNFPRPIAAKDVKKALEKCQRKDIKAAIMISWASAQRTGCVLSLQKRDLKLEKATPEPGQAAPPNNTPWNMTLNFKKGKGVKANQPYTVAVKIDHKWASHLTVFMRRMEEDAFLFPAPLRTTRTKLGEAIKNALREVDAHYEQRSLRRGALQELARNGTSEETLMAISGHKRVETLRRYLDWGTLSEARHNATREAAALLIPS